MEAFLSKEKTLESDKTKVKNITRKTKKGILPKAILIFTIAIFLVGLSFALYEATKDTKIPTPQPTTIKEHLNNTHEEVKEKTLKYWMLWTPADKKAQPPIRLTDEIDTGVFFKNNDEIEFFINSPDDGYFYMLHEPEKLEGKANYTILFPSPSNPITQVKQDQIISSKTTVYGTDKTEKIWFIWSSKQILGLEQAFIRWKGKESLSEIEDPKQEEAVKELLGKNSLLEGISIKKEIVDKQIKVLSNNNPLIYSIILKRK